MVPDEKDNMKRETDINRNQESSKPAWTVVPHTDEPETKEKDKAKGKVTKMEGEMQNKGSKGNEGFGLLDS